METAQIIRRLGGPTKAAKIFEIKPPSICEWVKNGRIPKARLMFLRLAHPEVFEASQNDAAQLSD